jgi:two-component sensor histidine kinase
MKVEGTVPVLPFLSTVDPAVERVRAHDWASTPLGPPETWSAQLIAAMSYVLESRLPVALIWGLEWTTIYNHSFGAILGDKPEAMGRPFDDVWAEVRDEITPMMERAFAGEAIFIEDFPLIVMRGAGPEQAYFTFSYSPVRSASGRIVGLIDTVIETTKAVQARQRSAMLNRELGHRLKNTMATVQAMAVQSLRKVTERPLVDAFIERVVTLGRAHDVLLKEDWERAPIAAVVERVTKVHGGDGRFAIDGPDLMLNPSAVLSLSMLLHELATNAVKHGAFSADGGKVALSWTVEGEEDAAELVLRWGEQGGPLVEEPKRKGFGSRLIGMGLASTGHVERQYLPGGLQASFRAPLRKLLES